MSQKRILFFSLTYHPFIGGAEVAIKEVTDRISDVDYHFDMITLRLNSDLPKFERFGNVDIFRIGKNHQSYAEEVLSLCRKENIRAEIWGEDETLGKRIRNAKMEKIPYVLVVGDKEIESGSVSVESRDKGQLGAEKISIFIEKIKEEIISRQ
jgi:threonyl-tRNA synthetase